MPDQATEPGTSRANTVSNTRALVCYALGVAAGLILGGISLFNARGTTTNRVPEENLALVNQRPILRSDFRDQLEAETGHPLAESTREEQLRVLDEMIREELFVQRGLELDFAETDPETRYALYAIVEAQILAGVTTGSASEEQLRAYYDSHRDEFQTEGQLTVHHLIQHAGNQDLARQAAQALRDGMPLEEAKQNFELEEAEFYADDFYYAARAHLGDALFDAAQALAPGEVSEPLAQEDGYHLVQLVRQRPPQAQSYEQAGTEVQSRFYRSEKNRVMNNMMDFLRSRSNILIADDYSSDYNPADFQDNY
ncbi:MAG TPA: peptidyl-prolyl cis-trans isomerase [Hyphomicrobiales bacterium]|nr:peptidyl-prolyl cis-trans isomerase [Hyphomicrobiales bacterium]